MPQESTGPVVAISMISASFVDDVSTEPAGDCPKNVLLRMHVEILRPRLRHSKSLRFQNCFVPKSLNTSFSIS